LNEVGHTSSNTGLSCLEKSILDEATRLSLLKSWKEKGVTIVKGLATTDNALKVIGTILSGADKALSVAMKGHERVMVDSHIHLIKQGGMGDLDIPEARHKTKQFDKLDEAINKLLTLSDETQPIILFIDDCQWIDDTSCEYIMTRLAKKVPLYIITSIRPSDAATLLKQHVKSQSQHEYSIALLKAIATKGHQGVTTEIDITGIACNTINLNGFDKKALNELVSHVIQGSEPQYNALTDTIFSEISGVNATTINTLFAIETINMLCDEKLYSENNATRLIINDPLQFNSDITDVALAIKDTFVILKNKYKDSLSHYEKSAELGSFNLMAYAVLEERLHLLKLYFVNHGNAAVNTLLFSSLLGAPFSSTIVKSVLEALSITEQPLLLPLKEHINQSEQEVGLTTEHYAIIDEVYEILSRYHLNNDTYQYRHGLLNIFLDKQLDHLLETLLIDSTTQAKEQMFELMIEVIYQENIQKSFLGEKEKNLDTKDYEIMLFFRKTELNILKKCFEINKYRWAKHYNRRLTNLAMNYYDNQQLTDAIKLQKESLDICKNLYKDSPSVWAKDYITSLNNLAGSYQNNQQLADAIKLQEVSLDICQSLYKDNPNVWAKDYSMSLNNLAGSYQNNQQLTDAIKFQEESLDICKNLYKDNPSVWAKAYSTSLSILAGSYQNNQQLPDAIKLQEESLDICKVWYKDNPSVWAKDYNMSLNNLALSYQKNQQLADAIKLQEESLDICKVWYKGNPSVWANTYTRSLNNLSMSYQNNQQLADAIKLQEESLDICKVWYKGNPSVWAKDYITSLSNLAVYYQDNQQFAEAIELEEESLGICKTWYKDNPSAWAKDYITCLNNLAMYYQGTWQLAVAIRLQEESLGICKTWYKDKPRVWAKDYNTSLTNLAGSYQKNQQLADAIILQEESLDICKGWYKDHPSAWAKAYSTSLSNLAVYFQDNQQFAEAIKLQENNFISLKGLYKENSTQWRRYYTKSLDNLVNSYQKNQQFLDAIKLEKESLDNTKALDEGNSTGRAKAYISIIDSLARACFNQQKFSDAIQSQKKSLRIRKELYQYDPTICEKDYTTNLTNLASSYANNQQYPNAIKLDTEALGVISLYYHIKPNDWRPLKLSVLNSLASTFARLKDFESASLHLKTYFDALSIETLEKAKDMAMFIIPFVKFYQVALQLADKALMEYLTQLATESIQYFQNKFKGAYQSQLKVLHDLYNPYRQPEDGLLKGKYEIFETFFIK
jgi:hypothetical protein